MLTANFETLMNLDVNWAAGPGWLLALTVCTVFLLLFSLVHEAKVLCGK